MLELNNIFGRPQQVEGVGNVYPITLNKYEEFMMYAQVLQLTKKHFDESLHDDYSLFELLVIQAIQTKTTEQFLYLFNMVTDNKFFIDTLDDDEIILKSEDDDSTYIDNSNFDDLRDTIMKQNLLYEDRVFKDPMVKKWADKALEAHSKNSVDMTLEDIVSVVHVGTGVSYESISNYTLYQLRHTFARITKLEGHRDAVILAPYSEGNEIEPFMEKIKLYKHPYDDVFVDKSKLKNINQIFNEN